MYNPLVATLDRHVQRHPSSFIRRYQVLVKDETDAAGFHWVPGASDGKPGRYDHPIDGVCLPGPDGPRWDKVPDGTNVTIHADGSATRSYGPYNWIPDFPDLPIFDRFPGWKREPAWSKR